jgi:PLP dependent protein
MAVSKGWPAATVRLAHAAGQRAFGENYLQEALPKTETLCDQGIEWHFIGPIQSNKTKGIALNFAWVHSIDRELIAQRLSTQRPQNMPPLNVCLQVNVGGEAQKAGVDVHDQNALQRLAHAVAGLPQLKLRGLMAIPLPLQDVDGQRHAFCAVRAAFEKLNADGLALDTLSMGMSNDMDAAIAEGATVVRIGSAIFGAR